MQLRLPSPLFVGGGTIEGQIALEIDKGISKKNKEKAIYISKLSVDVIGVEEISDGRKWIFLSLASELFDEVHPPPSAMVTSQTPAKGSELLWLTKPSSVVVPFCLNLPLNLGPPPYLSKQACIRYLLCPTAVVKSGNKRSVIRQTWNIQMLTVHDPEKALASLPSPLLATDSLLLSQTPEVQNVKLTAGLHRQTWVNGGTMFVDIHVTNNTTKTVKKLEIQLEKTTLWYSHSAAGTFEKSASHLRLPKRSDTEIVSCTTTKKSKEWRGIPSHSSEVRTCEIEAPKGHVTISTGRYFEVRYFINIIVAINMFKSVAVQLPVTLIHMNSLDILPNSLAQVAASIEAKRARTVPVTGDAIHPHYHQGQAFTAPRRRILDHGDDADHVRDSIISESLRTLTHDLDRSPRRHKNLHAHLHGPNMTTGSGISNENAAPNRLQRATHCPHHEKHDPVCYHCHCHLQCDGRAKSPGPKLPRLQVSTSGLGFSESDFEVPADSPPRKVMLSEAERKMINQERELRLQRQWSKHSQRKQNIDQDGNGENSQGGHWGWKNVAAAPNAMPKQPEHGNMSKDQHIRRGSQSAMGVRERGYVALGGPGRSRSRTNPERLHWADTGTMPGPAPNKHGRAARSVDTNMRPVARNRDRMSVSDKGKRRKEGGDIFYDGQVAPAVRLGL